MTRAPLISEQLTDIQGVLNSGYGWLTESRFWLLTIRDGHEDQAREWLSQIVGLVVSAKHVLNSKETASIREAVADRFQLCGARQARPRGNRQASLPDAVSQRHGKRVARKAVA